MIGIFYFSLKRITKDSQQIKLPDGKTGFIRIEIAKSNNLGDALDEASCKLGEQFMNTHYLQR